MHFWRNTWKNRSLVVLALPAVIAFIMFSYLPMFGLLLAFKRFDFSLGIFHSPWVGLENFKFLFASGGTMWRITRNTIGYFLIFTTVNTLGSVFLAIGINELAARKLGKIFQSSMILPTFISWVAVSFIVNAFLREDTGLVNKLLVSMDMNAVSWYIEPKAWPFILAIVNAWKGIGYGSVLYLSVLTGIDPELYEAAALDGANARQKLRYITLPMLTTMVAIMTLMSLGHIMQSDTGIFYQVTRNSGALYSTTSVLDSYVLNALVNATNYGMTTAATLYQSVVGFVMVFGTNFILRKVSPENTLF